MITSQDFISKTESMHMLLETLYRRTYRRYADPSQFDVLYERLIDAPLKPFLEHRLPYSISKGAKNSKRVYTKLRTNPDVELVKPYQRGIVDCYQAACLKYLCTVHVNGRKLFTDTFISQWCNLPSNLLGRLRRNTLIQPIECSLFDIRTDMHVLGTPKQPTAIRATCLSLHVQDTRKRSKATK